MLINVKIKNFLSIKDEEVIKINNGITSIIGKNESGKSTILKAIEKLNGKKIEKQEKNSSLRNKPSEITGTFRIEQSNVKKLNKDYSETCNYAFYKLPDNYKYLYFTISVKDEKDVRYFSLYYMNENNELVNIDTSIFLERILEQIKKVLKNNKSSFTEQQTNFFEELLKEKTEDGLKQYIANNLEINKFTDEVKTELKNIENEIKKNHWIDLLPSYKFVYFNSFRDVLSDKILIDNLVNNIQAQNILKIGNINQEELIEAIKNKDEVLISDIESQYIDVVTDKFKEIFQQTDEDFKLKLHISTGTNEIYFLTNDKTSKNHSINISERSDGFRWYLSIYLTLYDYLDEKVHSENHILLIDEPNLYLHAGAQRDLLYRIFKNEFQDMQIIYSTHSPYMIDADNTFSIRIIEKDDQTHIYNSSREYSIQNQSLKDIDAITPLLTSLELNISNTLIFDEKCKVFVVEGIQDVYIINAFIKKLKLEKKFSNIKFIPCFSSEKVPYMFGYLFGLGYEVFALVDDDRAGRKAIATISENDDDNPIKKNLKTYFKTDNTESDCLLESLFSENDKKKYLPTKSTINYKDIYDNYNNYEFEEYTINNFSNLLNDIIGIKISNKENKVIKSKQDSNKKELVKA